MALRFFTLWAPVLIYMVLIFNVSAQSNPGLPAQVSDKVAHAIAYMGLAIVVTRALAGGLPARITASLAIGAASLATGYGATDELHQLLVPGRTGDLHDLFADAAGACLGVAACWAWGIVWLRGAPRT